MNPREVVLQAIQPQKGLKPPRLPVALLSGGTWTFRQRGRTLKDVLDNPGPAAQIICDVNNEVHSDIVWPGSGYHNLLVHIFGGKIKFREQGNIDVLAPAFNTVGEADKIDLRAVDDNAWVVTLREIIAEVDRQIGRQYLIGTSGWGPFTLAGQFYGVEKMMSGLYKDKAGIHALLEIMTEVCYRYLAPAITRGAVLLSIAEPTASGDLISAGHFAEFVAPYLATLIDRLKKGGALITLHICGKIDDRLSSVAGLNIDLLSVDYKVDLSRTAQILAGKAALAGNVNPVTLKESPIAGLIDTTRRCAGEGCRYERFILMPGCDIPPTTPLANIQAFMDVGLSGGFAGKAENE